MMNVFVLQLMCVLMQSQVYSVMYTAAFKKFFMDVELLHHKLSLSVSLLDTTNLDLNEEEVGGQHAGGPDCLCWHTYGIIDLAFSLAEVFFPGERVYYSLLCLKLFPQEQPTLSVKGGAPNPYLSLEKFLDRYDDSMVQ